MTITLDQTDALKAFLAKHAPLEPNEMEEASANAHDGGNFNDTFDHGVELGQREMADDLRTILGWS